MVLPKMYATVYSINGGNAPNVACNVGDTLRFQGFGTVWINSTIIYSGLNSVTIDYIVQPMDATYAGCYFPITSCTTLPILIGNITVATNGIINYTNKIELLIYPNPSSTFFYINLANIKNNPVSLILVNLMGEKVFTTTEKSQQNNFTQQIDVRNLPVGIYFLQADVGGEKIIKKIIKE